MESTRNGSPPPPEEEELDEVGGGGDEAQHGNFLRQLAKIEGETR